MPLFRQELVLRTLLSPPAVKAALEQEVRPGTLMAFDVPGRAGDVRHFRGDLRDDGFTIIRRIQYRNSFVPVVEGKVKAIEDGSELALALYVHPGVVTFVVVWTVLALVMAFLVATAPSTEGVTLPVLAFAAVPVLAPAVALLAFQYEVPRTLALIKAQLPPWVDRSQLPPQATTERAPEASAASATPETPS